MKRALLLALVTLGSSLSARAEAPPQLHASSSCTPANKPGRIRCRAVVELPLEATAHKSITWAELRIPRADPDVTPLRGRLGLLDAETREPGRVTWAFSVAAAQASGDRTMTVLLQATIEPKPNGTPVLVGRSLEVAVRVSP